LKILFAIFGGGGILMMFKPIIARGKTRRKSLIQAETFSFARSLYKKPWKR
jgi:hypothetical protein